MDGQTKIDDGFWQGLKACEERLFDTFHIKYL